MNKVLILTEGGGELGYGHVTRCKSLYDGLVSRGLEVELVINSKEYFSHILSNLNFKKLNWYDTTSGVKDYCKNFDIIVVDSYLAPLSFYMSLSTIKAKCLFLDDNQRLTYPCGSILNTGISASSDFYPYLDKSKCLAGPQYALVREDFVNSPKVQVRQIVESVLITTGWQDHQNVNPKILKFLTKNYPSLKKNMVVGGRFNNLAEIKQVADSSTIIISQPSALEMKNLMLNSDLAISGAGQTLNELACVGLPTLAICIVPNQSANFKAWERAGFIHTAGEAKDSDLTQNLEREFKLLLNYEERKYCNKVGTTLIDGLGVKRVVEYCLSSSCAAEVHVRRASESDCVPIFHLSNDPQVRNSSFTPKEIVLEEHTMWFKKKIMDKCCIYLVAEVNSQLAGQLRLDVENDSATVSISVHKCFRSLNIGGQLLRAGVGELLECFPKTGFVIAMIRSSNTGSIHFFEKEGFSFKSNSEVNGEMAVEYVLALNSYMNRGNLTC